jgi:hypothetical protein
MEFVIPAKAGIQLFQNGLDPGVRRGDDWKDFLQNPQISCRHFLIHLDQCPGQIFHHVLFPFFKYSMPLGF